MTRRDKCARPLLSVPIAFHVQMELCTCTVKVKKHQSFLAQPQT